MSHFNGFHVFPRDNIRKTFTVMHNPVFEHSDTLSFALLSCIILYKNGTQFRCSVFTFVQYRKFRQYYLMSDRENVSTIYISIEEES